MDSPSSRAGNSSCDSGCYATGEGSKPHFRGGLVERDSPGPHQSPKPRRNPCRSCGKPKQGQGQGHHSLGHHQSLGQSPYAPGLYPQASKCQGEGHSSNYSYVPAPYTSNLPANPLIHHHPTHHHPQSTHSPAHSLYHNMATSCRHTVDRKDKVHPSSKSPHPSVSHTGQSKDKSPGGVYTPSPDRSFPATSDSRTFPVSRVSLTEEDQEVMNITYGTKPTSSAVTPPTSSLPASYPAPMVVSTRAGIYSPYLPPPPCLPCTGCVQCDQLALCDPSCDGACDTCPQCIAACPQCVGVTSTRQYPPRAARSDSKSSKMSCSSTCTQTTCLSPEPPGSAVSPDTDTTVTRTEDDGHYSTGVLLGHNQPGPPHSQPPHSQAVSHGHYSPGASQYHPAVNGKPQGHYSPGSAKSQGHYSPGCLQPHNKQPQLTAIMCTPSLPTASGTSDHPQPSPGLSSGSGKSPQLTLSLSPTPGTVAMSFPGDPAPVPDAASEAQGMATLYSRGKMEAKKRELGEGGGEGKSPTRSLMPLVTTKLNAERIDLTQMPYSNTVSTRISTWLNL